MLVSTCPRFAISHSSILYMSALRFDQARISLKHVRTRVSRCGLRLVHVDDVVRLYPKAAYIKWNILVASVKTFGPASVTASSKIEAQPTSGHQLLVADHLIWRRSSGKQE